MFERWSSEIFQLHGAAEYERAERIYRTSAARAAERDHPRGESRNQLEALAAERPRFCSRLRATAGAALVDAFKRESGLAHKLADVLDTGRCVSSHG